MANSTDEVEVVTPDDHKDAPRHFLGFRIHTIKGFRFSLYNHIYLSFDLIERRIRKVIKSYVPRTSDNMPNYLCNAVLNVCVFSLRVISRFKPDIIHATSPGFLVLMAMLFARLADVPMVISYHTHLPSYAKAYTSFIPGAEWLSGVLIGIFHNVADMTLVTSPQMQKALQRYGVKHVEVWQKGIDTRRFHPKHYSEEMRNALSDGHPSDPLLLYVGRLGREKKIEQLKHTLEQIPNARLALVGEGPNEEQLRRHFKGTNTKFMGVLRGEALSQAFASADVFCMPSDSETLGFVVLESMASGVPVVAANAGGLPDLIDHGTTGYLATVDDAEEFTERVKELIENPELRQKMGKAARAESEQWSWEEATRQLREVHYPRVLEIHRQRRSRRWSVRIYNGVKAVVNALTGRRNSKAQIASSDNEDKAEL